MDFFSNAGLISGGDLRPNPCTRFKDYEYSGFLLQLTANWLSPGLPVLLRLTSFLPPWFPYSFWELDFELCLLLTFLCIAFLFVHAFELFCHLFLDS
jgi:hypothetical protein